MFAISAKAAYFFIKEACRRLNGGGKLIAWVSSLLAAYTDGYSTDACLDVRTRELLTFSMLVALGGADPQVKGHVAANLNVGNDRAALLGVLIVLHAFIGFPRTLNGLNAVNDITAAR